MVDNNIKTIKVKSSGVDIAVAIHQPQIQTDQLAILCPGYLDSKDYTHLVKLAESLAILGYTVVRFDPRGTWESGGEISDYTITNYLSDVKNVLEFMLRKNSYTQILLAGHSLGGFVSMIYASGDPRISTVLGIMSAAVMFDETTDKLADWKTRGYRMSKRNAPNGTDVETFRVPYSTAQDSKKYDVLKVINKFHGLLLLVAGETDEVFSPDEIKMIYNKSNKPKKFILIEGIGHDYRHNDSEIEIVNRRIVDEL